MYIYITVTSYIDTFGDWPSLPGLTVEDLTLNWQKPRIIPFARRPPHSGRLIGFRWYVGGPSWISDYDMRCQLWRPSGSNNRFTLVHESQFRIDDNFNSAHDLFIDANSNIELRQGDMLGYNFNGRVKIHLLSMPTSDGAMYHTTQEPIEGTVYTLSPRLAYHVRYLGIYLHGMFLLFLIYMYVVYISLCNMYIVYLYVMVHLLTS